jgi:hypothetical protein
MSWPLKPHTPRRLLIDGLGECKSCWKEGDVYAVHVSRANYAIVFSDPAEYPRVVVVDNATNIEKTRELCRKHAGLPPKAKAAAKAVRVSDL